MYSIFNDVLGPVMYGPSSSHSAASMVLTGYRVYIPLDETIRTMMEVGRQMPACHRCTGGGLNRTPTGRKLSDINQAYIESLR